MNHNDGFPPATTGDDGERRQHQRSAYNELIRVQQSGRVLEGKGIDLSAGGVSFFADSEPDKYSSLDVIVLRGAIAIPGLLSNSGPANGLGYRVCIAFDTPQEEVYSVLTNG